MLRLAFVRLVAAVGIMGGLLLATPGCSREVIKEVPVEVIVEKEVIKEIQVPGETIVVEKEVIKEVAVPGETIVVEKEVVKEVVKEIEVPIVVEKWLSER